MPLCIAAVNDFSLADSSAEPKAASTSASAKGCTLG
jgi:hypothetical protein